MADDMKKRIASELEYRIRTAAALGHSQGKRGTDISAELDRQIEGSISALETMAGYIWAHGFNAGEFYEHNYGTHSEVDYPDNPYPTSEEIWSPNT